MADNTRIRIEKVEIAIGTRAETEIGTEEIQRIATEIGRVPAHFRKIVKRIRKIKGPGCLLLNEKSTCSIASVSDGNRFVFWK